MTDREAYEKALTEYPYEYRWIKINGDYERVDINELRRVEYAKQLINNK